MAELTEEERSILSEAVNSLQEADKQIVLSSLDEDDDVENDLNSNMAGIDSGTEKVKKAMETASRICPVKKVLPVKLAAAEIERNSGRMVRLAIKRELVKSGDAALLMQRVPVTIKKMLIPELTVSLKRSIKELKLRINRRVTELLEPLVPTKIRLARAMCGSVPFKEHPGFMWENSPAHNNYKLWVYPNIPYYIRQFTEMDTIRKYCSRDRIERVERLVDMYINAVNTLSTKETKMAIKLSRIETYAELLNYNIDCFYFAYSIYRNAKLEEAGILRSEGDTDLSEMIERALIDIQSIENEAREKTIEELKKLED